MASSWQVTQNTKGTIQFKFHDDDSILTLSTACWKLFTGWWQPWQFNYRLADWCFYFFFFIKQLDNRFQRKSYLTCFGINPNRIELHIWQTSTKCSTMYVFQIWCQSTEPLWRYGLTSCLAFLWPIWNHVMGNISEYQISISSSLPRLMKKKSFFSPLQEEEEGLWQRSRNRFLDP